MGAVAVERQLNTDDRSSKAARRKGQATEAPRQIKDTTRTRYNAIRHGILARSVVLPDEDPQQYEDLRTALGKDLGVVGMVEEMWLDRLVSCYWRQQRILRAEAEPEAKLEVLHRYEVGLSNEMKGAIAEIREAQRIRHNHYVNAKISPDRRREYAEAAAKHERGYWEAVQEDFDGPEPAPAPSRGAGVSPASPRGAAVPAAMLPPAPAPVAAPPPEPPTDVPVTDAAVRFAMDPPPEYIQGGGRVNPPMVRVFVGDREGLMSRREGV